MRLASDPTVLIVDDDPLVRDAVSDVLSMAGYEVAEAANGEGALEQLRLGLRIELILLDLMMPVMNGFEFLRAMRGSEEWRFIPVLMVSANRGFSAEDVGVAGVLRKPFTLEQLLAAVRGALDGSPRGAPQPS